MDEWRRKLQRKNVYNRSMKFQYGFPKLAGPVPKMALALGLLIVVILLGNRESVLVLRDDQPVQPEAVVPTSAMEDRRMPDSWQSVLQHAETGNARAPLVGLAIAGGEIPR